MRRIASPGNWVFITSIETRLRRGISLDDGAAFDAEIVQLNCGENNKWPQPHALRECLNFKPGSRFVIVRRP